MQINRANHLNLDFPSTGPQTKAAGSPSTKPVGRPPELPVLTVPVLPQESGVIYSGSGQVPVSGPKEAASDLSNMSLEGQLSHGKDMGVFTKITMSKDGVLVMKPTPNSPVKASDFVSSAVTTLRDFEEGIAMMKKNALESGDKGNMSLTDKFRGLQQLTSKLNFFA